MKDVVQTPWLIVTKSDINYSQLRNNSGTIATYIRSNAPDEFEQRGYIHTHR